MSTNQKALSPWKRFEGAIRRALFRTKPGTGLFDMPMYARVTRANFSGGKVDAKSKGFSVDVQPLTHLLADDPLWPEIKDVPLDPQPFGSGGAVYSVPKKGAIVRLGFMYHDPRYPFIMSVTGEGQELPEGSENEFRIESADGTIIQVKGSKIRIKVGAFNTDLETVLELLGSMNDVFTAGVPVPSDGGAALQTAWKAQTATWEGKLKNGSL